MEINEFAAIKLVLIGTVLQVVDISVITGCVSAQYYFQLMQCSLQGILCDLG